MPTLSLPAAPPSAEPLILAQLIAEKSAHSILHIAASDRECERIAAALAFFAPEAEIIRFFAWDTMPYDRISPSHGVMAERLKNLAILATSSAAAPHIILTTANAALQRLMPKSALKNAVMQVKTGESYPQEILIQKLLHQGYRRSSKAMEPGEFALRGSLMDIMPIGDDRGIRLDFFGNVIESIRAFDPFSQRSEESITEITLLPASEVLLSPENCERFRTRYREHFGAVLREDPLYEAISASTTYPGMEHWLPLFYETPETLFDYAEGALITFDSNAEAALAERHETIHDYFEARRTASAQNKRNSFVGETIYHPLPPESLYLMEETWQCLLAKKPTAHFTPCRADVGEYRPVMRFAQGEISPFDQLKARLQDAAGQKKKLLIACHSAGSCDRLQTLLSEREFFATPLKDWQTRAALSAKAIGLAICPLENGFETETVLLLSEQDIFGERIARSSSKKKKSDIFMAEAANFSEGELVVHKEHGIGRFAGLVTLTVSGAAHDCLKLLYEGDDKLFLPVENIEMVARYGADEEGAKLDKLGGVSWQARKAKLKERITLAAEALLKIAAERQIKKVTAIEPALAPYEEFSARFPYAETEDQERAIEETLADLAGGKPMDRLICGDVGFGKTEVALRAAFVAASSSRSGRTQVAVIVPTTLLARQHFKNFKERFAGFPITVRQLSRMVSVKEQKDTREKLATGEVDIVIGTHALLAKNIQFKNLALVIVDEEQHFGVAQKEKLKQLRSNVHVLTLSATPIPRTLQMALTGVRDLSLITTPPVDRLAVRSFVMPYDPVVLREALMREQHRGGRSFIVTPRIKDIAEIKAQLAEIAPEIKFAVAHGQMPAGELDNIMNDFYDGKFDALISTAIIESGLDIPTANTMIIFKAHLFGLAQLYQLRGRVGRGKTRAYAYFVLPHHKELTKNATKRLEVMQTLDTLGAGFSLASHDMDIRGFGNLVGEEQSGHIREVGIELYQQMLEEAVAALKKVDGGRWMVDGETNATNHQSPTTSHQDWSPTINLGLSVLIPETYVEDLDLRLGLYRRLSALSSPAEVDSFAAELVDRFGAMPAETAHLIAVLGLKNLCKTANIERIDAGPKGAVISFYQNTFANPEALLKHIERNPRKLKLRPDQKILFMHEWKEGEDKIGVIKKVVEGVVGLIIAKAG